MFENAVTWISAIAIIALTYTLVRFFDQKLSVPVRSSPAPVLNQTTVDGSKTNSLSIPPATDFKLVRRSSPAFQAMIDDASAKFEGRAPELMEFIIGLCEKNYDAASALFFHGREAGTIRSENCRMDLLMSLCLACIKVGSPHFIFKYLSEMEDMKIGRDLGFLSNLIRTLTSKKHYKICLSLNDSYLSLIPPTLLSESGAAESAKVSYSCLLYASVESKEYWRALKFFRQLERTGLEPTDRDLVNVVRAAVFREDWKSIVSILSRQSDNRSSKAVDVAIQALVAAGRPEFISDLISSSESIVVVDQVLSSLKRSQSESSFLNQVVARSDLQDSTLMLLSQCLVAWQVDNAIAVIKQMLSSSHALQHKNVVFVFNALLKKVSQISRMEFGVLLGDLRMAVYTVGLRPTLGTYSGLFKAAPSLTDIMDVYNLFCEQKLVDCGLAMDSSLLQTILACVSSQMVPAKEGGFGRTFANRVITDAQQVGVKPFSEKSVSILISILLKTGPGCFEEIRSLLTSTKHGDNKLYLQAIEGAIKQKNRRWTNTLFEQMVERGLQGKAGTADRVLNLCAKDAISFSQVLELALLNKLPVREETVNVLRGEPRVQSVLSKYKYRLPQ